MTGFFPSFPKFASNDADERIAALAEWLTTTPKGAPEQWAAASGDASFRRYFRLHYAHETLIAMDAPPDRENVAGFARIQRLLADAGVRVPGIYAMDLTRGFMLLDDLGTESYLDALSPTSAPSLYRSALHTLMKLQTNISGPALPTLPVYDEAMLRREIAIFESWCLEQWLGMPEEASLRPPLETVWQMLIGNAMAQPRVFVHRDFHSRNLMTSADGAPGVLDFQDAVLGPITYDLVSLLRDCYIAWPEDMVSKLSMTYHQQLAETGLVEENWQVFRRWMDWMGIQRHLKAIGIFCRLSLRDGKHGYLGDIPRTASHILDVCQHYPELAPLERLLRDDVAPRFAHYTA